MVVDFAVASLNARRRNRYVVFGNFRKKKYIKV
jgi:hypothetical protein